MNICCKLLISFLASHQIHNTIQSTLTSPKAQSITKLYNLDASNQFNTAIDDDKLINDIVSTIKSSSNKDITLDISSSLNETKIKDMLSALYNSNETKLNLNLVSRMNGISKNGFSSIIKTILEHSEENSTSIAKTFNNKTNTTSITNTSLKTSHLYIDSLDVSLNDIGDENDDIDDSSNKKLNKDFFKAMRTYLQSNACPKKLYLNSCGIDSSICRAIAKGLIASHDTNNKTLSYLHLSNNPLHDAGVSALAAALQTMNKRQKNQVVLEELNLSSCQMSDIGITALAIAIQSSCIKKLDLSNNCITDDGVIALGKAILANYHAKKVVPVMDVVTLDNNKGITDKSIKILAQILELGLIRSLSLRCCSIRSNGSYALGNAICNLGKKLAKNKSNEDNKQGLEKIYHLDLSGNELGILKSSLSKSKQSHKKVAMSYFNKLGSQLSKSLGDLTNFNEPTAESDDDFEEDEMDTKRIKDIHGMTTLENELDAKESALLSSGGNKCGIRSFVEPFVNDKEEVSSITSSSATTVVLGLRYCHLDQGGIEALAAAILQAEQKGIDLKTDISLNHALEEQLLKDENEGIDDVIHAFARGSCMDDDDDDQSLLLILERMAKKYWKKIDTIRMARQRAQIMENDLGFAKDDGKRRPRRRSFAVFDEYEEDEEANDDYFENGETSFVVDDYEENIDSFEDEEEELGDYDQYDEYDDFR